tara:strand:- start:6134 stop:6433 length:300 start_codon:yes stop_codon:yes gene_type:complete
MTDKPRRGRRPKYIGLDDKQKQYSIFTTYYQNKGKLRQYKKVRIKRYNFKEDCYDDCLNIEDVDKKSIRLFKEQGLDDHTINNLIIKRHKEYRPTKKII